MSDEREQANVVSTYADDLVSRRREGAPGEPPTAESGLADILDLTRTVSTIKIATPRRLREDLWRTITGASEGAIVENRSRLFPWFRMGLLPIAPVFTVAVGVVAFWWLFQARSTRVSAAELLDAASKAEAARFERPGFIAHRAYSIETRHLPASPVARRRVELWANPQARITARRLFDDNNRLLAGEWTNADGSHVVYEPGKSPKREAATDPRPLTPDTSWRWDPSARDFSLLVDGLSRVQARSTAGGFELSFDAATGRVAEADLTLDRERLPLFQRVVLREENGTLIEIQTKRESADEIPESRVSNATFQPETELLPPPPSEGPVVAALPTPAVRPVPALPIDQLELEASYRIHRLAGCLAQPSEIRRGTRDFRVTVLVASEACRTEAHSGFTQLAKTPGVVIDVSVVQPSGGEASVQPSPVDLDNLSSVPVYQLLYDVFARQALRDRQSTSTDVDAAVKPYILDFMSRGRDRSTRIVARARAMTELCSRWPPDVLARLGLDSAAMWRSMVRDHAQSLRQDADVLLAELQPIGVLDMPSSDDDTLAIRTLSDVQRAVIVLNTLADVTDHAIRRLLSPSSQQIDVTSLDPASLGRELRRLARLAEKFAEPWSLER